MNELRGLHLHVDAASGAAGDMMLGALLDLGVPLDVVGAALDAIGAGRERLRVTKVTKGGIAATDLKVDTSGELPGAARHHHVVATTQRTATATLEKLVEQTRFDIHDVPVRPSSPVTYAHGHHHHDDHDHHHPLPAARDHAHYHYADIRKQITEAKLTDGTRKLALDIFDRIARAEAKLHGTTVEDVSFHEVGAIDSVVDVVGTAAALDYLSPASVSCASVAMGHGTIHCSHGVLPVPAPAALEVMREAGGVMADGGLPRELCTPTGAAILAATVTSWTAAPTGRAVAVGWGAGDAELADRANVLRVVAMAPATQTGDAVWQLDANVDDMSSELCAPALEAVFAAGALDAWWTPISMKKGRPALMLSALVPRDKRTHVVTAILRETTTIGVRYSQRERTILTRSHVDVQTRFGVIPIKVAREGTEVVNAAPEYEACAAAAKAHGVAVKLVYAAALAAYDRAIAG
ncbi:MAG: nickel pincer cofactor biosynthesis protein LarC [Deltaproteobacteria bacterium]|nr:nickel pincer cofactor biosynthesis protein LarC [Deltaproteobacteria bacterium]